MESTNNNNCENKAKKAVLLVNMGGSESESQVKLFLQQMFLDKNILPYALPLRMFLSWQTTRKRYKKSWQCYQDMGGTDIRTSAKVYAKMLKENLGSDYVTETSFLYSNESPINQLAKLASSGIKDITVISLFPHPCICTHGQIREHIEATKKMFSDVQVSFVEHIYKYQSFNDFWLENIKGYIKSESLTAPFLIFSAHSIPQTFADRGDKYKDYVVDSATQIADSLGLEFDVGFQSRLGKAQWLSPETNDLLKKYTEHKEVVIVPISFICENLETKFDVDTEFLPYAREELGYENISRVKIPVGSATLLKAFIDSVKAND